MTTTEMLALIRRRRDILRGAADNIAFSSEADKYRVLAGGLDNLINEIENEMSPKKTDTPSSPDVHLDPLRATNKRLDTLEGKVDALLRKTAGCE